MNYKRRIKKGQRILFCTICCLLTFSIPVFATDAVVSQINVIKDSGAGNYYRNRSDCPGLGGF